MRVLCDVCEAAAAKVFCAADEAALCGPCDDKVHGCNKLASRHVRLELAESRAIPRCDICENAPAFFYCAVDGTSLCLQCDMDVHIGGKKAHERYLLMGQRVEYPKNTSGSDELAKQNAEGGTDGAAIDSKLNRHANPEHPSPLKANHAPHFLAPFGRDVGQKNLEAKSENVSDAPAVAIAVGEDDLEMNAASPVLNPSPGRLLDLNAQPNKSREQHSKQGMADEETSSEPTLVPELENGTAMQVE